MTKHPGTKAEWARFTRVLTQVLGVSKEEINRRIAAAQAERDATRQRPGPKPKRRVPHGKK